MSPSLPCPIFLLVFSLSLSIRVSLSLWLPRVLAMSTRRVRVTANLPPAGRRPPPPSDDVPSLSTPSQADGIDALEKEAAAWAPRSPDELTLELQLACVHPRVCILAAAAGIGVPDPEDAFSPLANKKARYLPGCGSCLYGGAVGRAGGVVLSARCHRGGRADSARRARWNGGWVVGGWVGVSLPFAPFSGSFSPCVVVPSLSLESCERENTAGRQGLSLLSRC